MLSTISNNVKALASEFISCIFCWVSREVNITAHTCAKLFQSQNLLVIYFPNNFSTPLKDGWFRDFSCISCFGWMEVLHLSREKKFKWKQKTQTKNIFDWTILTMDLLSCDSHTKPTNHMDCDIPIYSKLYHVQSIMKIWLNKKINKK